MSTDLTGLLFPTVLYDFSKTTGLFIFTSEKVYFYHNFLKNFNFRFITDPCKLFLGSDWKDISLCERYVECDEEASVSGD